MNFSGYFCLVAAAVFVVFAQQSEAGDKITNCIKGLDDNENSSDPGIKRHRDAINFFKQLFQENIKANTDGDPSTKLREGYSSGTQMLACSRRIMLDGVLAAGKIVGQNPKRARKLTHESLVDGMSIVYNTGASFYGGLGGALSLSNDGARQGLLSALKYIQVGGLAFLSAIYSGESLFNDGSEAGGRVAKASLNVYRLAIETAYAGWIHEIQKSANKSEQALRDAESCPNQLQIENRNCGVIAKGDPECSKALKDIDQVAHNALRHGANPALVQELKEIVKCAFDSGLRIAVDAQRILVKTKKIAEIDTFAAITMCPKDAEVLKNKINQLYAQLYLDIGSVSARSGHQSGNEVKSAYTVLEEGNVIIYNTITFAEQISKTGLENGGDASMLAFETILNSAYFAKDVFIYSIVECVKHLFTIL